MHRSKLLLALLIVAGALAAPPGDARAGDPADPDRRTAPPARVRAWQTGTPAPDRLQHASLAFSVGLALGIVTREPAAAGGSLALGFAKEIADRRSSRFDRWDLAADAVGALLAALAARGLDR